MSSIDTVTPASALAESYATTTFATHRQQRDNPLAVSSLASRRPSGPQPKPLVRPQPLPPRSSLLLSPRGPPGGGGGAPSVASHSTVRLSSPPLPHPTQRYPSPPTRPHSRTTHSSSPPPPHHAQHSLAALQGPQPEELIAFAALCRALYYDHDPSAAQLVDQTLQRLPAQSRTAYARTMAGVRAQFHRDEEIRRRREVEELLDASVPGGTIMAHLRISEGGTVAMRSKRATAERAALLTAFIKAHCLKGLPGSQPFFKALYAVLSLQASPATKGGAGKRRVEWEVDVAVFSEAGGGTWMRDSIEILKSVLGFTERVKEASTQSYFDREEDSPSMPFVSSDPTSDDDEDEDEGEEEQEEAPVVSPKRIPPRVPPHRPNTLRSRATSDPFLDPNDRRTPVANGPLTPPEPPPPLPLSPSDDASPGAETHLLAPSSSPVSQRAVSKRVPSPAPSSTTNLLSLPPPKPQFRIFTVPSYLTDPELLDLAALFPDFIKTKASIVSAPTPAKVDEESAAGGGGRPTSKVGHGELSIGAALRDDGWRGSGWQRFVYWLRNLFSRRR